MRLILSRQSKLEGKETKPAKVNMNSLTNIATPVMRSAVGIKDVTYPKSLGIENFGRPCGISPT